MDEVRREGDETWTALQELMRRVSSLSAKLKVAQSWVKEVDEQLDELIAFMRQKSSNICTVAKPKVSINVIDSTPQVTQSLPAGSQVSQGSVKPKGKGYSKSFGKGSAVESLGAVSPQVVASPTQGTSPYPRPPCAVCNGNHPVYFCPVFLGKSTGQRQDVVMELRLCRNCLKCGHVTDARRARGGTILCFMIPNTLAIPMTITVTTPRLTLLLLQWMQ